MKRSTALTLRQLFFSILTLLSGYLLLAAASGKKPEAKRRNPTLPRSYKPIDQIEHDIFKLRLKYPDLFHVEKIGPPCWAD